MKSYYRIMLGPKSVYSDQCYKGNFIGADFDIDTDLTNQLPDNWREFNRKFIPVWMAKFPGKSKVSAELTCGALWTVTKRISKSDIVLCPNGICGYHVGDVIDNYFYMPGNILPHGRTVRWYPSNIERSFMSEPLCTGGTGRRKSSGKVSDYCVR